MTKKKFKFILPMLFAMSLNAQIAEMIKVDGLNVWKTEPPAPLIVSFADAEDTALYYANILNDHTHSATEQKQIGKFSFQFNNDGGFFEHDNLLSFLAKPAGEWSEEYIEKSLERFKKIYYQELEKLYEFDKAIEFLQTFYEKRPISYYLGVEIYPTRIFNVALKENKLEIISQPIIQAYMAAVNAEAEAKITAILMCVSKNIVLRAMISDWDFLKHVYANTDTDKCIKDEIFIAAAMALDLDFVKSCLKNNKIDVQTKIQAYKAVAERNNNPTIQDDNNAKIQTAIALNMSEEERDELVLSEIKRKQTDVLTFDQVQTEINTKIDKFAETDNNTGWTTIKKNIWEEIEKDQVQEKIRIIWSFIKQLKANNERLKELFKKANTIGSSNKCSEKFIPNLLRELRNASGAEFIKAIYDTETLIILPQ